MSADATASGSPLITPLAVLGAQGAVCDADGFCAVPTGGDDVESPLSR